ncbi:hypothetical protein ABC270_08235 [Curtobacterium sp. 1P10AnD]|uniref:hypothetical protein n=1 Tax=Curtobacterium sp. 1P10AnD TaxID=3132283 RepID=UPI0039A01C50
MVYRPKWFRDDQVFISYAPTVGINKDGADLFVVDAETGARTADIDNALERDVEALLSDESGPTSTWISADSLGERLQAVPKYFDTRASDLLQTLLDTDEAFAGYQRRSLAELIADGAVTWRVGHGSPSADLRAGEVPYIKVSDLRAGQVNINPTNRVSEPVAKRFWRGSQSGLKSFDLLTPMRASKNIGEFSVLMPGQEGVVLTKEILVLRAQSQLFDNFYLLWALSLTAVRRQWDRIVFMQTNREDVGKRFLELELPVPPHRQAAERASQLFRDYYLGLQELRERFVSGLAESQLHHIHLAADAASLVKVEDSPQS